MTKNANFSPRPATKGCCTVGREDKSPHLCFSVPPPPSSFSSCSLALSPARPPVRRSSLGVPPRARDRLELPSGLGSRPLSLLALIYTTEREDLLAAEYNADLSVSIHRDREPSSSRVPLRRGYTYPPSAARCRERRRWRRKNAEGKNETGVFCAWPDKSSACDRYSREESRETDGRETGDFRSSDFQILQPLD